MRWPIRIPLRSSPRIQTRSSWIRVHLFCKFMRPVMSSDSTLWLFDGTRLSRPYAFYPSAHYQMTEAFSIRADYFISSKYRSPRFCSSFSTLSSSIRLVCFAICRCHSSSNDGGSAPRCHTHLAPTIPPLPSDGTAIKIVWCPRQNRLFSHFHTNLPLLFFLCFAFLLDGTWFIPAARCRPPSSRVPFLSVPYCPPT